MEENKKNKVPNVPNLRFAPYTNLWRKGLIKDCGTVITGSTPPTKDSSNFGNKYPFVSPGDLGKNKYIFSSEKGLSDNGVLFGRKIQANSILVTCIGSTIGKMGISKTVLFTNQQINAIECNNEYEPEFIYYSLAFNFPQYIKQIETQAVPIISKSSFEKLTLFAPEKSEQKEISSFLALVDSRIEAQNKIIEKLESLKIGIKERVYLLGKTKEPLERILHEVSEKSTVQNQYPVLSSTVKGLFLQSEYFDRAIASENNIGYKIVHKGQIIISPQNLWMGNLTFNDKYESGIVSPSYKIYEIDSKYSKKYIHWLLTSKRSFFNYGLVSEQGASIVRRNLNIDAFMELCLPIIKDKDDESKIEKLIDLIEKKLESEKKRGALLNQQKQFLLSNLFI